MAVHQKHSDLPPRYEAPDFTNEQRHRFTSVANAAHKRRAFYKQALEKGLMAKMHKDDAPTNTPKPSKLRQAVWLVVVLLVGLWFMYLFA
ncbi:hypothetical protein [Vibrio sp. CAU 1672]|uniref:hypothetical protein n=1 Tax=Vibrio sp. CAU 1672 TaxID=3032594 RepID=UPI0023DA1600|nr:hypothetical protein [Vibrio sp. CAU 1672]MDF2155205.1 hypothetical protein [Vibrio sp. CAU 1672]